MIDTHAHYHHRRFNSDRKAVLESIHALGVEKVIEVPISYESNIEVKELSDTYPWIYPAFGIHPSQVMFQREQKVDLLINSIKSMFFEHDGVAVGEIGLDYLRIKEKEDRIIQREWFARFVELSLEINKPLILHVREASGDVIDILRSYHCSFSGVVHCFSEDYETAKQYLDMGLALGIGGMITYDIAEKTCDAVIKVPDDMFVLETDAPFLTPIGADGKNSSKNIPIIAQRVSQLRGESVYDLLNKTSDNANAIFGI